MIINIHKFGPIENARIEFAPMTIFTGDSNLGKSYVNYLMYYLVRCTSQEELVHFFEKKSGLKKEFEITLHSIQHWMNNNVESFMRNFLNAPELTCSVEFELLPSDANKTFYCKYEEFKTSNDEETSNEEFFRVGNSVKISINDYSNEIFVPPFIKEKEFVISIEFSAYLQKILFGKYISQAFILPPARGAFVGENYTLKEKIGSSVGMYRLFLKDYDFATQYWSKKRKGTMRYSEQIERLVNGKLITKEGTQYIVLKTGKELPLSAAASSIKELSPLLYTLLLSGNNRTMSFCIEEPEAHLHPQMQVSMVDLLACCFNDGMMFQFTTHSDYVMQRINQLIKLEYIRQHDKNKFKEICSQFHLNEKHCLRKENIKTYYFELNKEGKVEIEELFITDFGFPMVTFFDVVQSMTTTEDVINNAIEDIQTRNRNDFKN